MKKHIIGIVLCAFVVLSDGSPEGPDEAWETTVEVAEYTEPDGAWETTEAVTEYTGPDGAWETTVEVAEYTATTETDNYDINGVTHCEHFNALTSKNSESDAITQQECDPPRPGQRNVCYVLWHTDDVTGKPGIQMKGCSTKLEETHNGLPCVERSVYPRKTYYCWCESNMCNQNDTWYPKPQFFTPGNHGRLECGGKLKNISGSVLSPNYPKPYNPRTECTWTIQVSAGSVILLRIIDLDLEVEDQQCQFDYIEIYEGSDESGKKIGRYCNRNQPPYVGTTSNVVTIRFRSDDTFSGRGFYINYQTFCHRKLHGFQGVLESPNFPNNYPNLVNCTWTIDAPIGNKLNLTFSHFDLEPGNRRSCNYDYLKIKEGRNNQPNTTIATFCGSSLPKEIVSNQNQVFLQFYTDGSISKSGFRIQWIVKGCGGHLTEPEGEITSPGYPGPYHPNIACEWTIEVEDTHTIEISLLEVNLGKLPKCTTGKLTVYDGGDVTEPELIKTCYTGSPITLTSKSNQLFVKFHAEDSNHHSRFKVAYRSVDTQCGGRFTASSGVIHSTGYKSTTPHCEWLIQIPANYLINLTFSDFDINSESNCTSNYVRIFDGITEDSHLLGSHCHSALPPSHISSGNELRIVERLDSNSLTKGFKAKYDIACGARIVTNDYGIISIDSAVDLHKKMIHCAWTIIAEHPGDHITFTLTEMQILSEMTASHNKCESNYLQIFDGEGTDRPLLGTWCNSKVPLPITSRGNALTIRVTSLNGTLDDTKFSGHYSVANLACGGNYTSEYGTISTPGYPNKNLKNMECIWRLRTSPGNRLMLNFTEFDLTTSVDCKSDYVEVREESSGGKWIGVYCGSYMMPINSPKSLWIKFKSSAIVGKGFVADYSQLYGGDLSGPTGDISSPLYPKPCTLRGEYFWRISVNSESAIRIQFNEFNIERSEKECDIHITLYDGFDENAPELLTKCGGNKLPDTIRSSSNVVYIKFRTHVFRDGSFFLLNWLQVPQEFHNHLD